MDAGEEIEAALFCDGMNQASASADAEVLTLFQGEGEKCLSDFQDTDLVSICQGGSQSCFFPIFTDRKRVFVHRGLASQHVTQVT